MMSHFYLLNYRLTIIFGIIAILSACAIQPQIEIPEISSEPYLGIGLSPASNGTGLNITQVRLGPFSEKLRTLETPLDLGRSILLSIDDAAITPNNWKKVINDLKIGQSIEMTFHEPDSENLRIISIEVGNRKDWLGPIDYPVPQKKTTSNINITEHSEITSLIMAEASKHQQSDAIASLHALFNNWQEKHHGFHSLSKVAYPFQKPMHIAELEEEITTDIYYKESQKLDVILSIANNLDLKPVSKPNCNNILFEESYLIQQYRHSKKHLSTALINLDKQQQPKTQQDLHNLLSELINAKLPVMHKEPKRALSTMQTSMLINYSEMLLALNEWECLINNQITLTTIDTKNVQLLTTLEKAITGEIQAAIPFDDQWLIIGGSGDNHYDMSKIAIVYDPDGDDQYFSSSQVTGEVKIIIDKQGDDHYQTDNGGISSAWLGISLLMDHAGDDVYTGDIAANGVGMMGIGLLIDHAGEDLYQGNWFSNGAAFYGAGIIINYGNEADRYHSYAFSQGIGGPKGLGLIYDYHGDDHYRSTGVMPSMYGVMNEYGSFSQGFGFGIRHFDSGGIGILYDANGNDHYEGGEFSQGGAYYWGLGILHDENGNDHYQANRYSQGFGVHQATGILMDKQGNDSYQSTTAACQGAAWDVAIGLLVDIQGDDNYQGANLCQGSAAMQAQAWLIDLSGKDNYSSNSKMVQGRSGSNTYHFKNDKPIYSWSVLLDTGGDNDTYSSHQQNNTSEANADFNQHDLGESHAHGLFIDTNRSINLLD